MKNEKNFTPVLRFMVVSDVHIHDEEDVERERFAKAIRDAYALSEADAEYINIYTGEGVSEEEGARTEALFAQRCPDAEVAAIPGGQSVYFYIISIE